MNKHEVKPGMYWYCREKGTWDKPLHVFVEERKGELVCLFFKKRHMVPLSEIPEAALFMTEEKVEFADT